MRDPSCEMEAEALYIQLVTATGHPAFVFPFAVAVAGLVNFALRATGVSP